VLGVFGGGVESILFHANPASESIASFTNIVAGYFAGLFT